MQKLRASVYLKNNKKRAAILVISFGLFFGLLYGVRFFISPSSYTDEVLLVKSAERMQTGWINQYSAVCKTLDVELVDGDQATNEEKIREINRAGRVFLEEMRAKVDFGKVYLCNTLAISVRTFIGNSYFYAPMLSVDEFHELIEYMGVTVSEGRLPENPGEIIVDERMFRNMKLQLGDHYRDKLTTIVGTTKQDTYFAAGIDYDNIEYSERDLFFVNHGEIDDLKEFLGGFGIEASMERFSEVQIVSDRVNAVETVEKFEDEIDGPLNVMTYMIMIVLAITVFFVYRLHVMDRYSEWCLYRSLGFSSKEVFFLALREYGICLLLSLLFSGGMIVLLVVVGGAMMDAQGMFYEVLLPKTLLQIFGIIVLLTGVMQIPVVAAMAKVKTIDAMEDD